jgi:basic amino acid/polyamine antiporter, APA family
MAATSVGRRLPAELALYRTTDARHRLPATFSTTNLTFLGIGVMVGGGIFSIAGRQAASMAGPAVIASFLIGALVCSFAALCYAELASILPVSGSVYTYSYVAFGERWAWFVGWSLILELVLAAGIVSRVFVQYVISTLETAGVSVPSLVVKYGAIDAPINLIAPLFLIALTMLIAYGTKLTGRAVAVLVTIKVSILATVIIVGSRFLDRDNFRPFVPPSEPSPDGSGSVLSSLTGLGDSAFGTFGVIAAAGAVVFAYVGFDLISTVAEETRDARRSVPRGILISFFLVTVLYLSMAVVLVGMRPYTELGTDAPFVDAMIAAGAGQWVAVAVGVGAAIGMATVVTVVLFAFSRLLFSMGRDQLLPAELGQIRKGWNAPANAAVLGGGASTVVSIFPKALEFEQLLVLCALFAFLCAAIGVLVLRRTQPDLERGFRIPGGWLVPGLAAVSISWLALTLATSTWVQFGIWLAVGLIVYFAYGHWHSRLATQEFEEATSPPAAKPLVAKPMPVASRESAPDRWSDDGPYGAGSNSETYAEEHDGPNRDRGVAKTYVFTWQSHETLEWAKSDPESEPDPSSEQPGPIKPPPPARHPFWNDDNR